MDDTSFINPPQSPFSQWILEHLFHQRRSALDDLPSFRVISCPLRDFPHPIRIKQGYPHPKWTGEEEDLTERHLIIDGCRATLVERSITVSNTTCHYSALLVYEEKRSFLYVVGGLKKAEGDNWFTSEMQAVISSFHIEKVAIPTSSIP